MKFSKSDGAFVAICTLALAAGAFSYVHRAEAPHVSGDSNRASAAPSPTTATPTSPGKSTLFAFTDETGLAPDVLPPKRWIALVAAHLDLKPTGAGGPHVGYVAEPAPESCAKPPCGSFASYISRAAATRPAAIIVSGGYNDVAQNPDTAVAAATAFFDELRAQLPGARLIVVKPWRAWQQRGPEVELRAFSSELERIVRAHDGEWIDLDGDLAKIGTPGQSVDRYQAQVQIADAVSAALDARTPNTATH